MESSRIAKKIFEAKAKRRKELARLPIEDKVTILFRMKKLSSKFRKMVVS